VLQAWMINQIPGGAEGLDQLVCDGKTLRGSAVEAEDGPDRFVAQVTVYARALGVALNQKAYDTGESSERAALRELLSTLDFEGVLIQADVLLTVKGNQMTLHRQIRSQFQGKQQIPFTAVDHEKRQGRDTTWNLRAKEAPDHIKASWPSCRWIMEVISTVNRKSNPV
jgi:hypothetical protein